MQEIRDLEIWHAGRPSGKLAIRYASAQDTSLSLGAALFIQKIIHRFWGLSSIKRSLSVYDAKHICKAWPGDIASSRPAKIGADNQKN